MKLTDFQELDEPLSDHHTGTKNWFVRVVNTNYPYYIFNDGSSTLGDLMINDVTKFYFDTKLEAYEASFAYYVAANNKPYPHFDDWRDEKRAMRATRKITNNGIRSQHMRFN